jgi:uncharacterized membrane protein YhiD involved in acid resistance
MDFMNSIFTDSTTGLTGTATTAGFLTCMGVSLILGIIIAGLYMFRNTYTKSFVITLALLPSIVAVIIMLVNGNIGAGIAVMGTFSLVRFRSAPGTAKEITSIFLGMAVGLAMGMGYIGVAVLVTVILGAVNILLEAVKFGDKRDISRVVRITIPESLDYTTVFDEVFDTYAKNYKLMQVKSTNMGSLFKLEYRVVLKDEKEEKKFLDDLRCRNGNLEILCSYAEDTAVTQVL